MSLNLLPSQAKFQVEKIKAVALSRKLLSYFLVVWVIVVLIVVGIEWGEKWWLKKQDIKYKLAVADYLQSSEEIVTSQMIKFRTKLLGKVLSDRFEYADAFGIVGNIFDSNITIKDFELKDKSFFVMSVLASDGEKMSLVESRVKEINDGVEPAIKNIIINSVTHLKSTGDWLVNLEVYLK